MIIKDYVYPHNTLLKMTMMMYSVERTVNILPNERSKIHLLTQYV